MADRKSLAGVCALALVALTAAACQQRPASTTATSPPPPAAPTDLNAFPQWAFPGPLLKSVPGSSAKFSDVVMYDRTGAVDWFPDSHPPMPDVVKGHLPVYACGFCHLPQGAGRTENAALAGLPAKYIIQQVADFKSGARVTPDPKYGAAVNMQLTVKQVPDADIQQAANYFASLKYVKHLKLVESEDVPPFHANAFVYEFDKDGPRTPLGQRIVEGPDDFERFEMRDPNMTFTAYVPVGAVARGAVLAKGNGTTRLACEACHGPGLKGGPTQLMPAGIAPPIAGRLPSSMFRQIYAIQNGFRHGQNAQLMKPVVTGLTNTDLLDLAAYVASLEP